MTDIRKEYPEYSGDGDKSGQAFPATWKQSDSFGHVDILYSMGLTKREWLAGCALIGLCSSLDRAMSLNTLARDAVDLAQATIEELRK